MEGQKFFQHLWPGSIGVLRVLKSLGVVYGPLEVVFSRASSQTVTCDSVRFSVYLPSMVISSQFFLKGIATLV